MHTRFANGAHYGAYAPLGYVKDPDKKGHLLIDPETRWIVEKILTLLYTGVEPPALHGFWWRKSTYPRLAEL